ncbi:MAG TPA: ABC transporter permease, partial [Thermomicrobiaceae bacterium]|nr:ABC transporter permease [Thermomicrobiaceae bacterium]
MGRVTIKELLDHKLRLALTAIAIVLGVTFITGSYVLTDTLNSTIDSVFSTVYQHVDFQVRGVAQFPSSAGGAVRNPIPESVLTAVRKVPGVKLADGSVTGYAQFVARDGKPIPSSATTIGDSYNPDQQISILRVVQGKPPTTSHDVVMDAGTAKKYGFKVGDAVRILFQGKSGVFTITGISKFAGNDSLAGATFATFTMPTAQALFNEVGRVDDINVVADPGANRSDVERGIARVLPSGVEVVTGQTVVSEQTSAINQALSFFSTALLVFAFISIFVGAFTILNTFSIIVG